MHLAEHPRRRHRVSSPQRPCGHMQRRRRPRRRMQPVQRPSLLQPLPPRCRRCSCEPVCRGLFAEQSHALAHVSVHGGSVLGVLMRRRERGTSVRCCCARRRNPLVVVCCPRVSASVIPARVFDARQHVSARWGHTSRLSFASRLLLKVRAERALANRPAPLPPSWLKAWRSFTVQHARSWLPYTEHPFDFPRIPSLFISGCRAVRLRAHLPCYLL